MAQDSTVLLAHVAPCEDGGWRLHPLAVHLEGTASLACGFAATFSSDTWVRPAAHLHDFGKAGRDFRQYLAAASGYDPGAHLEGGPGKVDHSTAGAVWAATHLGSGGVLLGYLIAGHHAGLPDWHGGGAGLEARLKHLERLQMAEAGGLALDATALRPPSQPVRVHPDHLEDAHVWIRMLFSCLVDADFLDTEAFMDAERAQARDQARPDLRTLKARLDAHLETLMASAAPLSLIHI